jgi:hypothetical protein
MAVSFRCVEEKPSARDRWDGRRPGRRVNPEIQNIVELLRGKNLLKQPTTAVRRCHSASPETTEQWLRGLQE